MLGADTKIAIDLATMILLPVVPAFLLYRVLPSGEQPKGERDQVTGVFQGLQIKLGGAFAGYFLVLLIANSYVRTNLSNESSEYDFWTVEGRVEIEPGLHRDLQFAIKPPLPQPEPNGQFVVRDVPVPKNPTGVSPTLVIMLDNHDPATVTLSENRKLGDDYGIEFNSKEKKITIRNRIVLREQAENSGYNELQAAVVDTTR